MADDPILSIDWTPRQLSRHPVQRIFDRLAGPGMTALEVCITAAALIAGLAYTWSVRDLSQ